MNRKKEFEEIALPYINVLYKRALKMTRNKSDAEDLVQDAYLRAWRFFDKFKKGTNFKAWLFKILLNIYINKYRKAKKIPKMVALSDLGVSGDLPTATTPEDEVFDKLLDLDDEVTAAMNALPEEFRFAVLLSDLGGFNYSEIADILGWPLGTVMSRLHRGRRLLRNKLYGYAKQHGYAKTV